MSLFGTDENEKLAGVLSADEILKFQTLINRQISMNGWFTKENVKLSLSALGDLLTKDKLESWVKNYQFSNNPKNVMVVMAGNIPLVGFHDFLTVLISGNNVICKMSSDDNTLLPALANFLCDIEPKFLNRIQFALGPVKNIDAVIATGSNNTLKYFDKYFGKYPHVFRSNRTSIAVLDGSETLEDINALGNDIFGYFGLGCRNVSHLLLPEGFDVNRIFEGILPYSHVINNNKYGNNYDYNKAVYLMNKHDLLDNNFVLLRESEDLHSPLSMVHYQYYKDQNQKNEFIEKHKDEIQVVIGKEYTKFGQAQQPGLSDFADGVDILDWLEKEL